MNAHLQRIGRVMSCSKPLYVAAIQWWLALLILLVPPAAFAAQKLELIYSSEAGLLTDELDRVGVDTNALRAILAMYALQAGGGCEGRSEGRLYCKLTASLYLGTQCSEAHVNSVRNWFVDGIPKMSGYRNELYKATQTPGELESMCYEFPDSASYQQSWTSIRVQRRSGHRLFVEATQAWLAPGWYGKMRYGTLYQIKGNRITVVRHRTTSIERIEG